jgi:small subunit ribosomal protein S1
MSDPSTPPVPATESEESFSQLLSEYEQAHSRKEEDRGKQIEGVVVSVTADSVLVDIGFKSEGILPLSVFPNASVQVGDKLLVSVKGRDPEGYYELSRTRIQRPTDWASLEKAFAEKATIVGTVTAVVKGGVSVDIGIRAFMPASRTGTRDADEMAKLVEQEIRCRIIKLDTAEEDVVVDRRAVLEEEERSIQARRVAELSEGATVSGTVRSVMDYGAFIDIGGVDALLHVSDISWGRISKPSDVISVGDQVDVQILKIAEENGKRRISVGMKQLQAQPWDTAAQKYKLNDRVRGTVSRIVDFGAFVELEPGIEGLIHISELSWSRKIKRVSEVVKQGETVEAIVLGINPAERRISLGLKQTLGDPWKDVAQKFPVGSVIEGPVTNLMKFGAFVQLVEGVEGMIHVSDLSAEKRINHPQDILKVGQVVTAQVLAIDPEKRQIKLGMKQLVPTGLDEYIAEHKVGDTVTGRLMDDFSDSARVELGDGIVAIGRLKAAASLAGSVPAEATTQSPKAGKADLSALGSMLQAKWKTGSSPQGSSKNETPKAGQIRSFRIIALNAAAKKIEVELG